jgi:hypothetical protein
MDLANDPANGCRLGCGEACPAPPAGMTSCSPAGTCDFACTPPFVRMGTMCVCTPRTCASMGYECGAPDDGCGTTLDCGSCGTTGTCIDGTCACMPDAAEENDGSSSATMLASYDDSADPPPGVFQDYNIDVATDVDWMRFAITDGTDFGNPQITVALDRIPTGADYALSAFYVCADDPDSTTCAMGTVDNELGHGCTAVDSSATETVELATDCDDLLSSDDSGTLYVRVRPVTWGGSCAAYRVTVSVR